MIERDRGGEDRGKTWSSYRVAWPLGRQGRCGTYAADVSSYLSATEFAFQRNLSIRALPHRSTSDITPSETWPISMVVVTTPDKAKAALKAVYGEIAQFYPHRYFTDEELESAKTILQSTDLSSAKKLSEYAHTLGFWWSSTGIEYFRGYQEICGR